MQRTEQEVWAPIPDFSYYEISNLGRIYSVKKEQIMSVSTTNHGHTKISLAAEGTRKRYTRSVAQLVAEVFVEPPNLYSDKVIVLDGDLTNVAASNLAWRDSRFAWKYTRQLKEPQPRHYHNLAVWNVVDDVEYDNIIFAGMTEGLLFDAIWYSTYTGEKVYPTGSIFEIIEGV